MLVGLLPGLRELRAPLAAGYLWLVTAWVLLHGRVETGGSASRSVEALLGLRDEIGDAGVVAAVTFLAYIIGALWEPISVWLGARLTRTMHPTERLSRDGLDSLGVVADRLFSEVDEIVHRRFGLDPDESRDSLGEGIHTLTEETRRLLKEHGGDPSSLENKSFDEGLQVGSRRDLWWAHEARDLAEKISPFRIRTGSAWIEPLLVAKPSGVGAVTAYFIGRWQVMNKLADELPLTARRLVGEEQELFLELSRMKGEIEFRWAVALPLAFMSSVVTFGLTISVWSTLLLTLTGWAACIALLVDGRRRNRSRNDLIIELLAIGKAKSPTFERLRERAESIPESERDVIEEPRADGKDRLLETAAASRTRKQSE